VQPFFDVAPANEYLVMMMMFTENAVWQCAVSQQFDGAVEVSFQPFCGDACVRVVIQCLVDAGDGLHLLQHSADVVTDKDDGAFFVNFRQQFIESGFKTFVDIRAGFVKDQYRGVGDDGTSQQCALQLSAAKLPDGTLFESFESHAGDDMLAFFSLLGSEAGGEGFLDT
jgi:hypothetical protein